MLRKDNIGNLKTGESTKIKQWEFIEWWDKNDFEDKLQQIDIKNNLNSG